jgi:hypothetical protein
MAARLGEEHHFAVLCEEDVRAIRRRRKQGETYLSLALAFGVSEGTIGPIVRNKTWRHLLPKQDQ